MGELYINPKGTPESVSNMARAMRGARLLIAAKSTTLIFLILAAFAVALAGTMGLWTLLGNVVSIAAWIILAVRLRKETKDLRVGDLRNADADEIIGFSRLNVVLDDAVQAEDQGDVSEEMQQEISAVLEELPSRFSHKDANTAGQKITKILDANGI